MRWYVQQVCGDAKNSDAVHSTGIPDILTVQCSRIASAFWVNVSWDASLWNDYGAFHDIGYAAHQLLRFSGSGVDTHQLCVSLQFES